MNYNHVPFGMSMIAHDISDAMDRLIDQALDQRAWRANPASQDRAGALRAEPLRVSGKAAHRISQENHK